MKAVWTIARMTFLEARRNKVTWSLLFFCVVLVLSSFLMQELTFVAYDRIVRDVGLATINFFGLLLSVFLGVSVATREIERRIVFTVLTKPISRAEYLLGKLLGVWMTIVVSLGMMMVAFLLENAFYGAPIKGVLFQAFWLMLVEFLMLASFSMLASGFTSSAMSAFMSISLFVVGHLSADIYTFGSKSASAFVRTISAGLFYVLPNLEKLNLKTPASLLHDVPASQVLSSTLFALLYVACFMSLAIGLFSRRDLK